MHVFPPPPQCSALAGFVWYQFAISSKSAKPAHAAHAQAAAAHVHQHHHTSSGGAKAADSATPLLSGGADLEKGLAGVAGSRMSRTAAGTSGAPPKNVE